MSDASPEPEAARPRSGGGRGILRAAALVGAGTLLVRLVGLAKNQSIAYWFGTGGEVEAFRIASMLLVFVLGAGSNALSTALIPVLARERSRAGAAAAARLTGELMGWLLPLLAGGTLLLLLLWPVFVEGVAGQHGAEQLALATTLFRWLAPSLLLNGLTVLLVSSLNAEKRFASGVLPAGAVPLAITCSLWLGAPALGARALAIGHLVGVTLEFLIVLALARRAGLAVRPRFPVRSRAVRDVFGQLLPLLGGALLMSSAPFVDQVMCATLPSGSLAALGYAHDLVAALLSISAAALGTAALPYLSDLAAAGDFQGMRGVLWLWVRRSLVWSLPVALLVWLFAERVVSLLFERGRFEDNDAQTVSWVLCMYVLQTPFFVIGILCARVLSALRANHVVLGVAGLNCVVNVGLNWLLMRWMGAAGIALSTSCVYAVSALCLAFAARRRLAATRSDQSPGSLTST